MQQKWLQAKEETLLLVDKLGMPVDKGIVETVTVLRLLGLNTSGSCAGHFNRITSGPYVMFQSVQAIECLAELQTDNIEKTSPAYRVARKKIIRFSVLEMNKLLPYVESFYKDRDVPIVNG